MSTQTATDSSTHRNPPPVSQYTSALLPPPVKGIPIPSLVTPSPNGPTLPKPGQPLPIPTGVQCTQDIELRSWSNSGNSTQGSSSPASSDDAQIINDGSETGSDDGQVIDDDPPTDEDEVGESDSEEALKPSSSVKPQPGAAKAAEHGLDPSTFSGVRLLAPADIKVGNYLASGAFGDVFRGRWNNEDVALKQIDIKQAAQRLELSEQDVLEAIQWEVSRMSTVTHPNLVEFHGVCFKGDAIYLVMEFCSQGSLQKVLESQRVKQAVPMSRLWQWMLEIAEGLAYLHSQGVVHRDLKADNILIDKNGRAKLADLGVAQVDALLQESEAKPVAQGMQDKLFVAPDSGGNSSSKESDVYALGLVFWQMLSHGAAPDSWSDMLAQDPELKELKAGRRMPIPEECPEPIRKLILSCWHAKAEQRASIEQLIQALRDMGPQLRGDHGLLLLAEHMEQLLHGSREEIRTQVPPLVTRRPVEVSHEAYWKSQAKAPATTTTNTTASSTTTTTTTTTTTSTPKPADTKHSPPAAPANPALDLKTILDDFIAEPGSGSLLLLGEGGMGKSLSMRALAARIQQQWWDHFADPKNHPRPSCLVLDLRSHVKSWNHADLKRAAAKLIKQYGLQDVATTLLVLVDGYDECRLSKDTPTNLARHLGLTKDAKLLVTCRPDALPQDQWKLTFALDGKLQQCHSLPFNAAQMLDYLKQHLDWDDATHARYQALLQSSAGLRSVLGNPFLLYLLSQSWPTISKKSLKGLTRSDIYAGFIEHTVNAGSEFLAEDVRKQLQGGHADLVASFEAFAQDIAFQAWQRKSMTLPQSEAGKAGVTWDQASDLVRQEARKRYQEREARQQELNAESKAQHKRRMVLTAADFENLRMQAASRLIDTLPLRSRGEAWEFIHKSVWEYCAAQFLLKLCGSEAGALDESTLQDLLLWTEDYSPEVLMFLREALEAAGKQPKVEREKANARLERRGVRNEAALLDAIGEVWQIREKFEHALENFKQALALRTSLPNYEDATLASSYHHIASIHYWQGNYEEALALHYKELAIQKKVLGETHEDIASTHSNIATVLGTLGRRKEEIEQFLFARDICEKKLGAEDLRTCQLYLNIATWLTDERDVEQADEYFNKAMAAKKTLGQDHPFIASVQYSMGRSLRDQGKYEEALKKYRLALKIRQKHLGEEHSDCALCHKSIGLTLARMGDFNSAIESLETALRLQEGIFGTEHDVTATTYDNLGLVYAENGRYEQAFDLYDKALTIKKNVLGPKHRSLIVIYKSMGAVRHMQKEYEAALGYYRDALNLIEILRGPDHADAASCHEKIADSLYELGSFEEGLKHHKTAQRIRTQCDSLAEERRRKACLNVCALV